MKTRLLIISLGLHQMACAEKKGPPVAAKASDVTESNNQQENTGVEEAKNREQKPESIIHRT